MTTAGAGCPVNQGRDGKGPAVRALRPRDGREAGRRPDIATKFVRIAAGRKHRGTAMDVRVAWIAVGMVLAAGQAGQAAEPAALIGTAIEKLGGRQKLEAISTLSVIARHRHWDPQETLVPDVGTRLGGTARFTLTQDIAGRRARYDWVRFRVAPMVRTFIYTEVFAGGVGYVLGEDNIVLSKQAKETVPSLHTMSASRVIAHQRELHRQSPRFLIEMQSHPDRLAALPDETIDGKSLSVVSYQGDDAIWYVLFGSDGLPARIRTIDADGVWGDSNYDLVLADWHDVGGVKFAFDQSFTLNGHEVQHINVDEIVLNPSLYDDLFRIPKIVAETAAKQKAPEQVNIQWMLVGGRSSIPISSPTIPRWSPAMSGPRSSRASGTLPGAATTRWWWR